VAYGGDLYPFYATSASSGFACCQWTTTYYYSNESYSDVETFAWGSRENETARHSDADEWPDQCDNCPHAINSDQVDRDGDGVGDACEGDKDGDGVLDDGDASGVVGDASCPDGVTAGCDDSCPFIANSGQTDTGGVQSDADGDGIGNACECGDMDENGLVNTLDARLIQRFSVGAPGIVITGVCDANGDGMCNTLDARQVQRFAVKALTKADLRCAERSGPGS
jgi:hypothetical protein